MNIKQLLENNFLPDGNVDYDVIEEAIRFTPPTATGSGSFSDVADEEISDEFNITEVRPHTFRAKIQQDGKSQVREFTADSSRDAMDKVFRWLYGNDVPGDIKQIRDVFFTHVLGDSPSQVHWIRDMDTNKLAYDKEGKHYSQS